MNYSVLVPSIRISSTQQSGDLYSLFLLLKWYCIRIFQVNITVSDFNDWTPVFVGTMMSPDSETPLIVANVMENVTGKLI